jgi:hypothetical protein
MNAQKLDQPGLLDVSPALEYGSPTPLSTHWMPLHELLTHWMDVETVLLTAAPVAPLLTAIGHALFALSHETRALRLSTLAWQKQQQSAPQAVIQSRCQQVVCHLHKAAHHWSRAAFTLDTLLPADLEPAALARARQLSRIARTQQERLWRLTEEVRADQVGGADPQEQGREAEA